MTNPIRVVEGSAKPYAPFWEVRNAAQTGGNPEINFYGFISEFSWLGDEITPKNFKTDLYAAGNGGPITIRMHSGGGEVFAASAIRAMLVEYPGEVTVCIEGLCASAAVGVALAGDKVNIYDTAYMMVHNPSYPFLMGDLNADALQKLSDELRIFKEGLLNAYETRTGLTRDALSKMLDETTWMTAAKAVELGFADAVLSGGKPVTTDKAVMNYANVPSVLLNNAAVENIGQEEAESEGGQEPTEEEVQPTEAQVRRTGMLTRLETVKNLAMGEPIMNMRQMQKSRAMSIARAEELVALVDVDEREFTEAEQTEFGNCLAEAESLGKKITAMQKDRERLQALAQSAEVLSGEVEKPAAAPANAKLMKRSDWEALDAVARAAYVKAGGKLEE